MFGFTVSVKIFFPFEFTFAVITLENFLHIGSINVPCQITLMGVVFVSDKTCIPHNASNVID